MAKGKKGGFVQGTETRVKKRKNRKEVLVGTYYNLQQLERLHWLIGQQIKALRGNGRAKVTDISKAS
jgi:hypothetical protein